jgi:hypothetical protein
MGMSDPITISEEEMSRIRRKGIKKPKRVARNAATHGRTPNAPAVVQQFADWSDAFSVCREMDKPITVAVPVNDVLEVARIFPSGRCKHLRYESQNAALSEVADKTRPN